MGGVLMDARNAVLLAGMDVMLMDAKTPADPILVFMALRGRVNYSSDEVEHAYMFGPDGAAALCSELAGLASRAWASGRDDAQDFAAEYKRELTRRMEDLP
jgi:hypothetical protein